MNKLKELEQKYKELGEEIERLKNQGKVWNPEYGELYYSIFSDGGTGNCTWGISGRTDKERHDIGNCFKTIEEAGKVAEKIKIYTQLKRLAEEINTEPVDWGKSGQSKYKIYYDWGNRALKQDANSVLQMQGTIYSTNREFFKYALCRIGEKNLLKLFKED